MNNTQVRRRLFRKSSFETEEPIHTKYRKSSMSRQERRHVQSRDRNRNRNRTQNLPQSQNHHQNEEDDVNLSDEDDNSEWDDRVEINSSRKASVSVAKGTKKGSSLRSGYSPCSCNCNSRVNELSNEVKLLLAQIEIMSNWVQAKFGTQLFERESLLTHYSQDFCEIQEIAELLTSTVPFPNDDNDINYHGNKISPQNAKLNSRQTRSQSNQIKSTSNSKIENRNSCRSKPVITARNKKAQSIQEKSYKKGIKLEEEVSNNSYSDIELIDSELESDEPVAPPTQKTSCRENGRTRKETPFPSTSRAKNEVENTTIIIKSEITSDDENRAAANDLSEVDLPEPSYYLYDPDDNGNGNEDPLNIPDDDDNNDIVEVSNSDKDFEYTSESDEDDSDFGERNRNRNRTRKKSIKAKSKPNSSKPVSNRGQARDRYRNRAREEYEKAGVEHLLDEIMSGKHTPQQQKQQQQHSSTKSPAAVKEPGQCDECGLILANANTLKEHKKIHTNTRRDFKCDICDKAFFRSYNLREHYVTHLGPAGKSLKCQFCDKLFIHGRDLDIHERTHTGERPFMCHICPKTFNVKQHLTYHIRTHTGEKPCVCPDCHRGFSQPNCLRLHKKRCTGVPLTQRQKQRKTHRPLVNNLVSSLTARLAARSASEAAAGATAATTYAKTGSTSSTLVQEEGQELPPPLQNAPSVLNAPNSQPLATSTWDPQHVPGAPLFPMESALTNLDTQ